MTEDKKPEIWQLQSQLDIEGLEKALTSSDVKIRQRAAAALRTMRNVNALPALQAAFEREEDAQTRMSIAAAIELLKDLAGETQEAETQESQVKRLIGQLKTDESEKIVQAAHELGELGDKLAVESLILIFNDQKRSIQVRLAVAEALLKLESAPVEVALLANLRHADWVIRRNGAAILGKLKAEWAIQPLARALNDPHPTVRRTALAALKYIGTPESRKALAQNAPNSNTQAASNSKAKDNISGIDVKRPGKPEASRPKGMLRKLAENQEDERSKLGTRPLDGKALEEHLKRANATQAIDDTLLDQLGAILDEEDPKNEGDESPSQD